MRRTTLAVALATGALAIPAVALAAGGNDTQTQAPSTTTPIQQQEQQAPDQQQQAPNRGDCPNHDGGGGQAPDNSAPTPDSSGSGNTQL